jgi:peptide-methionine (S)-S-oxide reductase
VGYAGGTTPAPTYRSIGDHMEAIEATFDPRLLDERALLDLFWSDHDPTRCAYRRQYASAIFVRDDAQRRLVEASFRAAEERFGRIATEILPAEPFFAAEDYHQKYRLRSTPALDAEYRASYPRLDDYVASTATMRVNAWLDGEGCPPTTDEEFAELGLSPAGIALLRATLR